MSDPQLPVLIVGAGPAGLATAALLSRHRVPYRLFERGEAPGTSWANAYESLRLHTGRRMSALPGRDYPAGTPLFPTRTQFLEYLRDYAAHFHLPVETGAEVTAIRREGDAWVAQVGGASVRGSAVVMATGIMSSPVVPPIHGQSEFTGDVMHTAAYRRPDAFVGRKVLVVGVGNSGGEIGAELARAGAKVTVLVRSGAHVVPVAMAGVPIQYVVYAMRRLPRPARAWVARQVARLQRARRGPPVIPVPPWGPLDRVPIIGFHLDDAIRAGLVRVKVGALDRFEGTGVRFADGSREPFDVVMLATGFRPALASLGSLVRRDDHGFAVRTDLVSSADQPGLFFVGHNYDTTGAIFNIGRDAAIVARRLAADRN